MEIREKIKQIRQEKKMSREDLHQSLMDIFGENAVTPNTIWRIESGLTDARASSLHQICIGLGVSLKDILGEAEPGSKLVDIVKRNKRLDQYIYNQKAQA